MRRKDYKQPALFARAERNLWLGGDVRFWATYEKTRVSPRLFYRFLAAGALHDGFDRRNAAALLAAAREDFTTVLCAHASTKTMDASSAALFGLVGSLGSHIFGNPPKIQDSAEIGKYSPLCSLFLHRFDIVMHSWNDRRNFYGPASTLAGGTR